jgi:hypothetical protein
MALEKWSGDTDNKNATVLSDTRLEFITCCTPCIQGGRNTKENNFVIQR